ncbi:MAG: helix-turn-helix domain-containing protein [Saprospiraceae bacterium]|nr:helix-turn-helix domain-containing protein [Saprospiraceae bacterium]
MLTDAQVIRLIFGFKTRYLRLQKKLSYQELSKMTGLSTSYLNDIEKGKRYPKPDKITNLAIALGVDYNYMVATNASKKLQPIIDLLHSNFFKLFPLEEFGLSTAKMLELFTQTPDRVNAFISTIFKLARNYQVGESQFYKEALRSYQDMYNNYFGDIEEACRQFKQYFSIKETLPFTTAFLEEQLSELYDIKVDRKALSKQANLQSIRSYYEPNSKRLFVKDGLKSAQDNFLLARELGYQFLKIEDRAYETTVLKIDSFDKLLNYHKASYFAAALLMSEEEIIKDIKALTRENVWKPELMLSLVDKYNVTPDMLLQRLTNILPHHFGLEDLFFIKLRGYEQEDKFTMTKNLHLSRLHNPYNNELSEHYCRRWVSVTSLHELHENVIASKATVIADTQISKYWQTDNEYLCISLAKEGFLGSKSRVSVTLGLLINDKVRGIFNFLSDPKLKYREVHTTCERCGIVDCESRAADPVIIKQLAEREDIFKGLARLG